MNPSTCPSCSAPLEPLATRCAYCSAVTPKGRAEAERVEHEARARQAYAHATAAAQASMAQAANAQLVARSASHALVATILGFVLCCAPSSWVGAFFAWRSLSLAGKHGVPKPTSAYVAMVLSILGTITSVSTCVAFELDQQEKKDRRAAAEARSEAGRKKTALDAKTACDITEAYLLGDEHPGLTVSTSAEITCKGPLDSRDATARLSGIVLSQPSKPSVTYRACFARGARWYLLDFAERGDCGDEAPKADTPLDEKRAREEFVKNLATTSVTRLEGRLATAKAAVERAPTSGEKACASDVLSGDGTLKNPVRALDYGVLDGKADADFAFLSDPKLSRFLSRSTSASEKQRLAGELGQETLLVVYRDKSRSLPSVSEKGTATDFRLEPGEYDGTLYVVDVARGEVACHGPVAWKTPAKPPFPLTRSRSSRSAVESRALEDFRQRFHDAATDRLKALAGGKLKLGYKPLE